MSGQTSDRSVPPYPPPPSPPEMGDFRGRSRPGKVGKLFIINNMVDVPDSHPIVLMVNRSPLKSPFFVDFEEFLVNSNRAATQFNA
jgi:hypothetical protein